MEDYHADMRLNDEDYDDDIPDEESLDSIAANLGYTSMADYYADVEDGTPFQELAPSNFVWPQIPPEDISDSGEEDEKMKNFWNTPNWECYAMLCNLLLYPVFKIVGLSLVYFFLSL